MVPVVVKRIGNMSTLVKINREIWVKELEKHQGPEDKFARGLFVAKADRMGLWNHAVGSFDRQGKLTGAIIVRVSKRGPRVANLQLLHTFHEFRNKGIARRMVAWYFERIRQEAQYFRVSSEPPALGFYRKIGFKFWGPQKSKTILSFFKIGGPTVADGVYDMNDPVIKGSCFTKKRGGVAELYDGAPL